jgi:DNA repair protein RecN (Recombination protein N)
LLEDLTIKDFALIQSVSLEFDRGFTVLTGETGAGKSILIGALSFLLGGKADLDVIRAGASEASVSGIFLVDGDESEASAWLSEMGVQRENNRVLLRRILRDNGKQGAWIQDRMVTRSELAAFSAFLVDIHGQHDHQSLLRVPEHRRFLDSYAGLVREVADFTVLFNRLLEKRKELEQLDSNNARREEKIEILSFAVSEIESARLAPEEDEELAAEETRLSQFEKLYAHIDGAAALLSGNGGGLLGDAKRLCGFVDSAAQADNALEQLSKRCESAFYELSDIASEVRSYSGQLVFDPARLEEIQERLAFIYKLKKKYAQAQAPLREVIAYGEKARAELAQFSRSGKEREALKEQVAALEKETYTRARALSAKRKEGAQKMAAEVEAVLAHLGMKGTRFTVQLTEKEGTALEQKCGPYGMDNIEFLICANLGSPEKPLAKIASGGEISRVMLALKTVLAASDPVETLIFDEIDAGIGGEVAISVGAHLKNLAQNRQILCITHLASIAVYADTHIRIEKQAAANAAKTGAQKISGQARVSEIARMLAGDAVGAQSLEHARSLLAKYGNFSGGS